MVWQQLVQPDISQSAKPGWCLNHVQRVYGAPWSGSTATDGWNRAQFKHPGQTPPRGVSAPVWFAMKGEPAGHVVAWLADESLLSASSGNQNAVVHHPNLQDLLNYYGGRLTLRGWSEDIGGKRIVKEVKEDLEMVTNESCYVAFHNARMRPPTDDELKQFVGKWTLESLNTVLAKGKEREKVVSDWLTGQQSNKDDWPGQIRALKKQLENKGKKLEPGTYIV